VTDFLEDQPGYGAVKGAIDNPYNDDNVYLDESLKERLRQPIKDKT